MKKLIFLLGLTLLLLATGCTEEKQLEPCSLGCESLGYDIGQCVRANTELSCESLGGTEILADGKPIESCSFRSETAKDQCCCLNENQETPDNKDCVGAECDTGIEEIILTHGCEMEKDCAWTSTNCCPGSSGALWECVNEKESTIKCSEGIACPEFISPKPMTDCSCVENTCVEIKEKPELLSPACGLITEANQPAFSWNPAGEKQHSIIIYRINSPEPEIEASETTPGFFSLNEPIGDGEYYWTVKENQGNESEKCSLTILRQKITCSDLQLKLTECWQKFNEIESGQTEFCGEIIGYENNCEPEVFNAFIGEDNRFAINAYNEACTKIEFFYNKTNNLEPGKENFNKAHLACSEGIQ